MFMLMPTYFCHCVGIVMRAKESACRMYRIGSASETILLYCLSIDCLFFLYFDTVG